MRLTRILLIVGFLLIHGCFLVSCKTTTTSEVYQGRSEQQIYQSGQQNFKKHHYSASVRDFEALNTLYPFGPNTQRAQLKLIDAYYQDGNDESALAAADRYIRLYPRSSDVDYAYYMKGVIHMGTQSTWFSKWMLKAKPVALDISKKQLALENFQGFLGRFPNSKYAPDARKRVKQVRNLLARHELIIAQYYLKRKAYVAAANRSSNLVNLYPEQSVPVATALGIMVESYRALNQPKLANQARQRLLRNYPNSLEAKR